LGWWGWRYQHAPSWHRPYPACYSPKAPQCAGCCGAARCCRAPRLLRAVSAQLDEDARRAGTSSARCRYIPRWCGSLYSHCPGSHSSWCLQRPFVRSVSKPALEPPTLNAPGVEDPHCTSLPHQMVSISTGCRRALSVTMKRREAPVLRIARPAMVHNHI
jgi:hypothetical protein